MKFNDRNKVISGHKLYKNMRKAKFLGVCAGVADFFDIDRYLVRIVTILSGFIFTMPTIVLYLLAGAVLAKRPDWTYH
ncbi:MAG: hypothetical protein DRQ47_07645 [Gammaproteobacteria bacterium]|nr:MAG: hypothetical protein DRQ47_07645 [Gammaproteobacteria bacterium]